MKLPHTSHPVQRTSAGSSPIAGVNPSLVYPQASTAVAPPAGANAWLRGRAGKGAGECQCTPNKKLGQWVPTSNNCGFLGVPQCDTTGGCRCVHKAQQKNDGRAVDITGVQSVMNSLLI